MVSALRLVPGFLGMDTFGLLASPFEFGGLPLRELGFRSLDTPERTEVPRIAGLGLDIRDRYNVDVVQDAGSALLARAVGGFSFADPHPDDWWDGVHARGAVPVIVGNADRFAAAHTVGEGVRMLLETGAVLGDMPLVVRAYPTGVGTAAPGE